MDANATQEPSTDALQPEPIRQGGLSRHTFKQPARPTHSPSPETSQLALDLDRLALNKRSTPANEEGDWSRKKPRLDDGEQSLFKGLPDCNTHRFS